MLLSPEDYKFWSVPRASGVIIPSADIAGSSAPLSCEDYFYLKEMLSAFSDDGYSGGRSTIPDFSLNNVRSTLSGVAGIIGDGRFESLSSFEYFDTTGSYSSGLEILRDNFQTLTGDASKLSSSLTARGMPFVADVLRYAYWYMNRRFFKQCRATNQTNSAIMRWSMPNSSFTTNNYAVDANGNVYVASTSSSTIYFSTRSFSLRCIDSVRKRSGGSYLYMYKNQLSDDIVISVSKTGSFDAVVVVDFTLSDIGAGNQYHCVKVVPTDGGNTTIITPDTVNAIAAAFGKTLDVWGAVQDGFILSAEILVYGAPYMYTALPSSWTWSPS